MKRLMILGLCIILLVGCGSNNQVTNTSASDNGDYISIEDVAVNTDEITVIFNENVSTKSEDYYLTQNSESYNKIIENDFIRTGRENTSTFSIDVDTASYANIRRMIFDDQTPNPDAVRIEEMINYFDYDYPEPTGDVPFSITTMTTETPWHDESFVTMIGVQGKSLSSREIPASNIVLLLDVSGSMQDRNKLPLLKDALEELIDNLTGKDRVSIVVYAGSSGVVLDGAEGNETRKILRAIDKLEAGGSTAGSEGIEKAYELAEEYFIENGNNRVVLATDGDFNVGISDQNELEDFISEKKETGVFLSVIGFGSGNIRDDIMETLADKGNGNYNYIDSLLEAKKVFNKEFLGTMFTIAKDVKIQVEFNSDVVESYRLIGYENRVLNNEDFDDDRVDAGELGAGHEVTALYEIYTRNNEIPVNEDLYDVKLRFKEPDGEESKLIHVMSDGRTYESLRRINSEFRWALAVAEFGLLLRDSEYQGDADIDSIINMAEDSTNRSEYREEFIDLVETYDRIIRY